MASVAPTSTPTTKSTSRCWYYGATVNKVICRVRWWPCAALSRRRRCARSPDRGEVGGGYFDLPPRPSGARAHPGDLPYGEERGEALVSRSHQVVEDVEERMLAGFDTHERIGLLAALRSLVDGLDSGDKL